MVKRGEPLRDQILWAAKEEFLAAGFDGASMDRIATRAGTTKRTVYAHFEKKEKLFLAVLELVRARFLDRVKTPSEYAGKPPEALVQFCGRYLEILTYEGWIRMCRMCLAETRRFPEAAAQCFGLIFAEVHRRLAEYLRATYGLAPRAADEAAERLLGEVLYPRYPSALFGTAPLAKSFPEEGISPKFDLQPIRRSVRALLATFDRP